MKKVIFWIACLLVVVIIFQLCYGLKIILPSNVSWLMTAMHDWGAHYLGWLFYRQEPWHFPIGDVHGYFYPIGTNVGYTDSIPLLAIFFKLLKGILPGDFQYFGIWLFACHLLAAYYTVLLCRLFKVNYLLSFIAVIFIVANPVLIYRGMHPALCAHWLLIASVYLYFLHPTQVKPSKILLRQFILLLISALVNPYLCFMVLGFSIIIVIKLCYIQKAISRKHFFAYLGGSLVSLLLCWWLIGLISFNKKEDMGVQGGYGLYGLNLNSLHNPFGFSSVLPSMKHVTAHQYEGFMYLGLGIILLLAILIGYLVYRRMDKKKDGNEMTKRRLVFNNTNPWPLLILVIVYTLFSVTHVVTFNDHVLFKLPIPSFIVKLGEIFRASARFFWPVYYLILFFILIGIAKSRMSMVLKRLILAVTIIVQLYDTKLVLTYRHLSYGAYTPPIDNPHWNQLISQFDEIVFYPPFEATNLTYLDYQYFCYLAGKAGKKINTGYVARLDNKAMQRVRDSLVNCLADGKLSPRTLYITTPANLDHFSYPLQTDSCTLNYLDGYYYLYSKRRTDHSLMTLSQQLNDANKEKIEAGLTVLGRKIVFVPVDDTLRMKQGKINHFIEHSSEKGTWISLDGWAFNDTANSNKTDSVFIVLKNDNQYYAARTTMQPRPDVTAHFKKPYLDNAGFYALIFKDNLRKGIYELAIAVKDINGNITYTPTGRIVKYGMSEYATVENIRVINTTDDITFNAETVETDQRSISISGWAFINKMGMEKAETGVVLRNDSGAYLGWGETVQRPDVTSHFKNGYNLDNSGFKIKLQKESIPKGKYQLLIIIRNKNDNKQSAIYTGKDINTQ